LSRPIKKSTARVLFLLESEILSLARKLSIDIPRGVVFLVDRLSDDCKDGNPCGDAGGDHRPLRGFHDSFESENPKENNSYGSNEKGHCFNIFHNDSGIFTEA